MSRHRVIQSLRIAALASLLAACVSLAHAADIRLGHMKANSILFLGNSITLHGPYITWNEDAYWGMAASEASKDYVHLLTSRINAATGGAMTVAPPYPMPDRWYDGDPLPDYEGNILNIADIFERTYTTWDNARIQNQIDAKPDIVVLQFGENMSVSEDTLGQFSTALDSLLAALKDSSDPNIFITSYIFTPNTAVDAIKRQACEADPTRRVYVDLVGKVDISGAAGHPNDAGMQTISDELFDAMVAHSAPEPGSLAMLAAAGASAGGFVWSRRTIRGRQERPKKRETGTKVK